MIFLTDRAQQVPFVYEIAIGAHNYIKHAFNDLPDNILVDITEDESLWGQCTLNRDNALIEISESYLYNPKGLYDTLVHEFLHACEGCRNKESNNHNGEWLKRAKILGIQL